MKRTLLATASLLSLGLAPAAAADLAYKAAPQAAYNQAYTTWSGLYLGLNAGYGQQSNCWNMNGALLAGFTPATPEGCNDATGALAGGQIGYRHQWGSLVFGIEAQGDWTNLTGHNASTVFSGLTIPAGINLGLANSTSVDAIGMFTGQLGYSFGGLLWYVKGGVAVTDNKYSGALAFSVPRGGFSLSATDTASSVRFGEVVGTGLEYALGSGWSVGAEYNHLFMGTQNTGFQLTSFTTTPAIVLPKNLLAPGMPTRNDAISGDLDLVTIRLNYKFTGQ